VLAPLLEVSVHRTVVPKAGRESVLLVACPQAKDDAIEDPAQVDAAMPLALRGLEVVEHLLNNHPHIVGDFPYCWLSFRVHKNPPVLYNTGGLSSDQVLRLR
jgi:hypothetical protein